jgi:hypothetical protein
MALGANPCVDLDASHGTQRASRVGVVCETRSKELKARYACETTQGQGRVSGVHGARLQPWKKLRARFFARSTASTAPTVREKDWRDVFITGAPPDAGAEMAYRNSYNAPRPAQRTRGR